MHQVTAVQSPLNKESELAKLTLKFEEKHGKVKRRVLKPKKPKPLELTAEGVFAKAWEEDPLPGFEMVREHKFDPNRGWRYDFAWPAEKLAVELNGQGRHQRVLGEREDMVKMRSAVLKGWRVLTWQSMEKKNAADWVRVVKLALLRRDGQP